MAVLSASQMFECWVISASGALGSGLLPGGCVSTVPYVLEHCAPVLAVSPSFAVQLEHWKMSRRWKALFDFDQGRALVAPGVCHMSFPAQRPCDLRCTLTVIYNWCCGGPPTACCAALLGLCLARWFACYHRRTATAATALGVA